MFSRLSTEDDDDILPSNAKRPSPHKAHMVEMSFPSFHHEPRSSYAAAAEREAETADALRNGEHEGMLGETPSAPARAHLTQTLRQALELLEREEHHRQGNSFSGGRAITVPPPRKKVRRLSKRFTNKLLFLSACWQGITIGILSLLDATLAPDEVMHPVKNKGFLTGAIIIILLQLAQLVLIVMTSVKLTKQMLHHTASSSFIVQSYLSTILLYSGIYTLLLRLDATGWSSVYDGSSLGSTYVAETFVRMLYFSIATMTSTGYGDIHPARWYTYLIVCSQMLLSVVYETVIFARGMEVLARIKNPMAGLSRRLDLEEEEEEGEESKGLHALSPDSESDITTMSFA